MFTTNQEAAEVIVSVLKQAKPLLWDGTPATDYHRDHKYLCYAVNSCEVIASDDTKEFVKKYIIRTLDGYCTFGTWLDINNPQCEFEEADAIQQLRIQWVDKMIADLSRRYL